MNWRDGDELDLMQLSHTAGAKKNLDVMSGIILASTNSPVLAPPYECSQHRS